MTTSCPFSRRDGVPSARARDASRVDKIFDGADRSGGDALSPAACNRTRHTTFQDFMLLEDGPLALTVLQKFGIDGRRSAPSCSRRAILRNAVTHQGKVSAIRQPRDVPRPFYWQWPRS